MPRIRITARKIESIRPPKVGQVDYWDESLSGFGLRVSMGGKKTWVYMYRQDGRKWRYTIGPYPAYGLAKAREEAKKLAGAVADGENPAANKKAHRSAGTFKELAEKYLEEHAKPNKRSWRKDNQAIERDLLPVFGWKRANIIDQEDVEALIESIKDRGAPVQSNRTLEILRGIFNWGLSKAKIRREFQISTNPCQGVKKLGAERQRDRVLSDDEMKAIWLAAGKDASRAAASFKLRLMTAQRGGEVQMMRWEELDLESRWWTIPAEHSKNGLAHRVPLTDVAIDILQELEDDAPDPVWVFPKARGDGHVVNIQKLTARIRKRAKVKDFRPHDIRRSIASALASMGFPRLTIAKILNHVETDITRIYDRHGYDAEKRHALEAWAAHLEEILFSEPKADNVVKLAKAAETA